MAKPPIPPELQKSANSIPYYGASGVISQKGKELQDRASELMGIPDRPSIPQFLGLNQSLGMDTPPAVETAAPAVEVAAPSVFLDQPKAGLTPTANIGQLPQDPSPSSTEASASAAPAVGVATPPQASYTPPAMDGSQIPKIGEDGFRFAERGSPQDFFLAQTNDGTTPLSQEQIARGQAFARQQGMNFEPTTGFSQGTQAPEPQVGFTPQATTFQGTDLQGRLRQFASPEARQANIEAGQSSFEQASADRELRAEQQFGQARGPDAMDRGRPMATGEGTSTADLTAMAKANARGASPSDVARGHKVANSLGVDLKTGESKSTGMTIEQELAERKFQAELAENNRQWETAQANKTAEAAAGVQETQQSRQKSIERMDDQLSFLKKSAKEMSSLQDWSTEGLAGWVAEKLPIQTKAAQVNRLATSFQGNAFLRSIIDSKSLGATFGALSDSEGAKITAAETTLMDTKQGNDERMAAAKQIIDVIENAKARAMKEQGGGASSAPRYSDDQDDGVKVETYYQG